MILNKIIHIPKYKTVITSLFVALCVSFLVNSTFFTHSHHLQSGVVTHAHPFSDSHTHTPNDLLAIDALTFLNAIEIDTACSDITPLQYFNYLYNNIQTSDNLATFVGLYKSLRAPPVSI